MLSTILACCLLESDFVLLLPDLDLILSESFKEWEKKLYSRSPRHDGATHEHLSTNNLPSCDAESACKADSELPRCIAMGLAL